MTLLLLLTLFGFAIWFSLVRSDLVSMKRLVCNITLTLLSVYFLALHICSRCAGHAEFSSSELAFRPASENRRVRNNVLDGKSS